MFLSLFLAIPAVAQTVVSSDPPVLEIVRVSCLTADCSESSTWRAHNNGTVILETNMLDRTRPGRPRRVMEKAETKLDPEELAELLWVAEKADFLNASPEYVATRVIDSGSLVKMCLM